jgi:hypothetical protein
VSASVGPAKTIPKRPPSSNFVLEFILPPGIEDAPGSRARPYLIQGKHELCQPPSFNKINALRTWSPGIVKKFDDPSFPKYAR